MMRILTLFLTFVLAIGAFAFANDRGWLSPIGIGEESHDSQIIEAVQRTQEVALVSLAIQGITDKKQKVEILGQDIPLTGKTVFVKYGFTAKLGFDGSKAEVKRTGANSVRISVPEFTFIGYDDVKLEEAASDGGALSWVTPDIDRLKMTQAVLSEANQRKYVAQYEDLLKDQTEAFYDALIAGVDKSVTATYEFDR